MPTTILVLVSNTANLGVLPEVRNLQEALLRSQYRDQFKLEWRVVVKQEDLRHAILDVKPRIVHFCGHGTTQGLILAGDADAAKIVPNEVLVDLLKTFANQIECVVLNACDTEPLAEALSHYLNYVIGMNQLVQDDAAVTFATGFYDGLGAEKSYERAFEIGKHAVLGQISARGTNRTAIVVDDEGHPITIQNQEHQIPVLKINPNPKSIQPFWLSPEVERQAVRALLADIESRFNTIQLFHTRRPIVLQDQYIPVQVTLERQYRHPVETLSGYAEAETELKRAYAIKGLNEEEIQRQQVNWQEAKKQQSRMVVLADPGMGKSTLLRREVGTTVQQAYLHIEAGRPLNEIILPFLIRLSTLADEIKQLPVDEAILKIMQARHPNWLKPESLEILSDRYPTWLKQHEITDVALFLNAFLKTQLLGGKGLLLLDALDEVPDLQRPKLLDKLNEFAKAYPQVPLIGTSRIVNYGGRLVDGAKDVEIVPFTQRQTEQYIEKWFQNAQESFNDQTVSSRGLIQALRERPQIAGLAQNPLLLSLICSLYQQNQLTLPVRRCELYEQAVNYMLGQWRTDNERQPVSDGWVLAKKELLEKLAYEFSKQSKQIFSLGELRKQLEIYLKSGNAPTDLAQAKTADLIKEICDTDGILQRWTAEDNRLPIEKRRYLFLHRTFQEYLTAAYLSRADEQEIEFETLFWNYDWHETISLMAGLIDEPIHLLQKIRNTKDDIFYTQLLLSGRCLSECQDLYHPIVQEITDDIYKIWLTYPDAEFIRAVVVMLGQTQIRIFRALQAALKHESLAVRRYAALMLGKIGNEQAIDALISVAQNSDMRSYTIAALGELGGEKALNWLVQNLSDSDPGIRHNIVSALEKVGNEQAVSALAQLLSGQDPELTNSAVFALERIGNAQAVDVLIQALSSQYSNIRSYAVFALAKIGSEQAVDTLIQLLSHPDSAIRRNTISALEKIGNAKAVDVLVQLLSHPDSEMRRDAVFALNRIGNEQAVEILIQALLSQYSDVRGDAIFALEKIGHERAIAALSQALFSQYSEVRNNAIAALGRIGSQQSVSALAQLLSHQDSETRRNTVFALARIGNEHAIRALAQALSSQYSETRGDAVFALKKIDHNHAVEALIQALSCQYSDVRDNAVFALEEIGSNWAIDALIEALFNQNYAVESIVGVLERISTEKTIDALIRSLFHWNEDMIQRVVFALGNIGNEKTISALIHAFPQEKPNIKTGILFVIEKKENRETYEEAIDMFFQALADENSDVRRVAANALAKVDRVANLERLLQLPNLHLEDASILSLARYWAIRFSQAGSPFTPIYPEVISTQIRTEISDMKPVAEL